MKILLEEFVIFVSKEYKIYLKNFKLIHKERFCFWENFLILYLYRLADYSELKYKLKVVEDRIFSLWLFIVVVNKKLEVDRPTMGPSSKVAMSIDADPKSL